MTWLKDKPAKAPASGPHVHLEMLMGQAADLQSRGLATPALQYLLTSAPRLELDKWGQPLPLSAVDQDRLDRLFAILADPYDRGRQLLVSGLLGPDEVDAMVTVHPDVWQALAAQAYREMAETKPPYRAWAEATLGVLFGQDAAQVFTSGAPPEPGKEQGGGVTAAPETSGTAADRRETSVRDQRS